MFVGTMATIVNVDKPRGVSPAMAVFLTITNAGWITLVVLAAMRLT